MPRRRQSKTDLVRQNPDEYMLFCRKNLDLQNFSLENLSLSLGKATTYCNIVIVIEITAVYMIDRVHLSRECERVSDQSLKGT